MDLRLQVLLIIISSRQSEQINFKRAVGLDEPHA